MEPLPSGANFIRSKTLWEIGLHIAGNPATPYGGNRDMCIVVGTGSGEEFRPWLRMATGSPLLAHAVAKGEIEMAFVNPSGLLTQAYRGTGVFSEPLPVRVVASYPSWDRCVFLVHPRTGITALGQIAERKPALRISIREEKAHSTRVLTDQLLALYGISLKDLESWGATFQEVGPPGDMRRVNALKAEEIDLVIDEGIRNNNWFDVGLEHGMRAIELEPEIRDGMAAMGWRIVTIPAGRYPHLTHDYTCIDYSGWPLYTRASLPDDVAYDVVGALHARTDEIPWEENFGGTGQLGTDTEATPIDVPLHPGAERWYREHGFLK
ncbi:MAG TPA: TAXI family TRAP transporter solute-binding subunit [Chloroflexota bacterium]|nr:TAXI family TRAP transporter solute-binding subunit [Chloroflexota bacterium]